MTVYLSPSSKEYIISSIDGKSEANLMGSLADEVQKDLVASGITVIREPSLSPNQSAENSNNAKVDLHLVLSTLKSTDENSRGIKIYYNSADSQSRDYAEVFAKNLKEIYPLPQFVTIEPSNAIVELIKTKSPAVVISIGNPDNKDDVTWFSDNIGDIASNISLSVNQVLGNTGETLPMSALGLVNSKNGYTTVRKSPSPSSKIIARIQNGAPVRIIGKLGSWYAIIAANIEGYIPEEDVTSETPEK